VHQSAKQVLEDAAMRNRKIEDDGGNPRGDMREAAMM
jgi:hypothetical protein